MLPCNKIGNLRRRVARAERFPHNTCPASRHLRMIADDLRRGDCPQLREDPEHCAATMLSVLESLWKLRTKTKKPNAPAEARCKASPPAGCSEVQSC